MKPLETNRRILMWFCLYPFDKNMKPNLKLLYTIFSLSIFLFNVCALVSSIVFFFKFLSINLEESFYSLFQITGIFGVICLVTNAYFSQNKIENIFMGLTDIYDAYTNDDSFKYLKEANRKSEFIWRIFFVFALMGFLVGNILMTVISLIFCWLKYEHFDVAHVYYGYRVILPWDQTTAVGYLGEVCFQLMMGEGYLISNGALLLLLISMCWHHQAFHGMFRHFVCEIDSERKDAKWKLCELVRFHILVKSWFTETTDVYSLYTIIQLVSSMTVLASTILQLDLQSNHADFSILLLLMASLSSATNLYFCCFFGKLASDSFEKMSDCLYESTWQELSIDLQKHLLIMIANAQRRHYYHGFGIAVLNLDTFCKVLKTVFTYYMMFKTIASKY